MQNRRVQNANMSAVANPMSGHATQVDSATAANVLKNTYWLLGLTLAFSAFTAYLSMGMAFNPIMHFGAFIGALVISFVIHKVANSVWGLVLAFAFTGLLGLTIGPIVGAYLSMGAAETVTTALGLTAFAFFGLSGFVLTTKKDFSFLSSFLVVGFCVIVGAVVLSFFIESSGFALAISGAIVLFASAAILYETSAIVHGGQTNYILAAVSLYASIYNLFMSLLHILMAFAGDE
ncbi:Bax inhibitor-1/YccA family protein [Hahella ganghwensis]|uniref:Bax inhibitor-1/YccA family protein n=1 Tax=Hahella ganghwensis TaxID=286420 RepID=UPI00036288E8|nr:Bax inhibitor-1/YccA family protein [Hahella ganghwensis]